MVNEFVASLTRINLPEGTGSHTGTNVLIYGMSGFADPDSLGIIIGGLNAIAPDRKQKVIGLGVKTRLSRAAAHILYKTAGSKSH